MQNNAPVDRVLFTTRTPLNQMEQFGSVGFNDALYLLVVLVNHLIMNGGPFRLCLTAADFVNQHGESPNYIAIGGAFAIFIADHQDLQDHPFFAAVSRHL